MKYVVFGGTGSFGSAFTRKAILEGHKVLVASRDEAKQIRLEREIKSKRLSTVICDVSDYRTVSDCINDGDIVINAAAQKHVPACEHNIQYSLATNVNGVMNVARACRVKKAGRAIFLSTDKAVYPVNVYGQCKAIGERIWVEEAYKSPDTKFIVSRYGNVINSSGSVLEHWMNLHSKGNNLPITDKRMTRFWITMEDAVDHVFDLIIGQDFISGSTVIPDMPSFKLVDLAEAIGGGVVEIGVRQGEKLDECIMTAGEYAASIFVRKRHIFRRNNIIETDGFQLTSNCYKRMTREDIKNAIKDTLIQD